jgi:hypothetical protein
MKSFEICGVESNTHDVTIIMRSGEKITVVPGDDELMVRLTGMAGNTLQKLQVKAMGDYECQFRLVEEK